MHTNYDLIGQIKYYEVYNCLAYAEIDVWNGSAFPWPELAAAAGEIAPIAAATTPPLGSACPTFKFAAPGTATANRANALAI